MDRTAASGLVVSGLAQVALGALAGILYAIATYKAAPARQPLGYRRHTGFGSCTWTSSRWAGWSQ
jgi:hypothetical protein